MRFRPVLIAALALTVTAVAAPAAGAAACDSLDPAACLLPWPNDSFTKHDAKMPTGKRLNLTTGNLPANSKGVPIQLSAWDKNDGFSPGSVIMTQVPGLDLAKTGAVPITDIAAYAGKSQSIIVLDTASGKRWPIWAEADFAATTPTEESLQIHPATNFLEGHRYIVALRNLRGADGSLIKPGAAFAALRSGQGPKARRKHFAAIFKTLKKAGVSQKSLYLAWDFTVGSGKIIAGRLLAMRNDAFKQLGDTNLADGKIPASSSAPKFTIDKLVDQPPCSPGGCLSGESDRIARKVEGTVTVPCYLDQPGCPPGAAAYFKHSTDLTPSQMPGNVMQAKFLCNIPRVAFTSPSRPSLYGHGLLGDPGEIDQGQLQNMSREHNFTFCATAEIGMAEDDVGNAIKILGDFSTFNTLADRLQQGMVNGLYLGRLMIHPKGLISSPAFQNASGQPVLDISHLYYDGNSQGGIFGGGLTAVAPDFTRAALGVPGMNYSLLLPRSTDWNTYKAIMAPAYPNVLTRQMLLNVAQVLWDRGEGDGYAQHMTTDPLPNTPKHQVLLNVALGDHQVAQISAETEARTIGAAGYRPTYGAGRSLDKRALWGIPTLKSGSTGSGIFIWDSGPVGADGFGTPISPIADTIQTVGRDPHELPRNTPAERQLKSDFLAPAGKLPDPCAGAPCRSVRDY